MENSGQGPNGSPKGSQKQTPLTRRKRRTPWGDKHNPPSMAQPILGEQRTPRCQPPGRTPNVTPRVRKTQGVVEGEIRKHNGPSTIRDASPEGGQPPNPIKGSREEVLGKYPTMSSSNAGSTSNQNRLLCETRMVVPCIQQVSIPAAMHLENGWFTENSD